MLALLNDTVGVMAAGRYYDPATEIGMIIGTGTNACYVEKVGACTPCCLPIHWPAMDMEAKRIRGGCLTQLGMVLCWLSMKLCLVAHVRMLVPLASPSARCRWAA